jgi:uncharacterized YigZ family protein
MPEPKDRPKLRETFRRIGDGPETTSRVKGSRFTAQALAIRSPEEALDRLETIRKRYHDATHHCWAATWGPPESSAERFDDDGEPSGSAGRPILRELHGTGDHDGLVVVTRWFGGTKLGTGGLVQAYGEAAREALERAGRIRVTRQIPLRLETAYDDVGTVEAILARRSAWIIRADREFGERAVFGIGVRSSRAAALRTELVELLAGRLQLTESEPILVEG